MLFDIILYAIIGVPILGTFVGYLIVDTWTGNRQTALGFIVSIIFSCFLGVVVLTTWTNYASMLATVAEQNRVIMVHTEQRDNLKETLNSFDFPKNSLFSVNADNPISAITKQLAKTESSLARAKEKEAAAYKKIEAVRLGPMSGIMKYVGDK